MTEHINKIRYVEVLWKKREGSKWAKLNEKDKIEQLIK